MSAANRSRSFLYTDIVNSVRRFELAPVPMRQAVVRYYDLVGVAVAAANGRVFKQLGDGILATFPSAVGALAAAIEAQRAVQSEPWADFGAGLEPLDVRMGLHTGPAEPFGTDFLGQVVNHVARIGTAASGGQILVSSATARLVRRALSDGMSLRDHGLHRLPGELSAEHIFQVVAPYLPDNLAPPQSDKLTTPSDRIQVAPATTSRVSPTVPEDLQVILEVIRSDDKWATLSVDQLRAIAGYRPGNLQTYALCRIAEWSQPRYQLDRRFVKLTVMLDQGELTRQGRWLPVERQYDDLERLLDDSSSPASVVLGPPGSGKSTLLRKLQMAMSISAVQGKHNLVTFCVSLNKYAALRIGEPPPPPREWLAQLWKMQSPDLPALETLLSEGRVVFLLDALNEMPSAGEADYSSLLDVWKQFVLETLADGSGNRGIFTCRSLDYSAPLSTPDLRVPQVRIEPMDNGQVREFLELYSPAQAAEIWEHLAGTEQLEIIRRPYFLRLLIEQVEATGRVPSGPVEVFTSFVRNAMLRELESRNPHFLAGQLVDHRDRKLLTHGHGPTRPFDLPQRGRLIPGLADLAFGMQARRSMLDVAQVCVSYDDACALVDVPGCVEVIEAGVGLGVLDEDLDRDEVMFSHHLLQEYFAARRLAVRPDETLVHVPWRADDFTPALTEVLAGLPLAEPLPPAPATAWDETTILAATMASDPDVFIRRLMDSNLPLAARCAVQPEVTVSEALKRTLRRALVARSRESSADLRARVAAGQALGRIGDPRFERQTGPFGEYLSPPMILIGSHATSPANRLQIGQFPVTNAEFRLFMLAGAYDDEQFWLTPEAKAWRVGVGTGDANRLTERTWRRRLQERPELLDEMFEQGLALEVIVKKYRRWIALDDGAFEAELAAQEPDGPRRSPSLWNLSRYSVMSQPVVGVSWYEAGAYAAWLRRQSGIEFRLPTLDEWYQAAREQDGQPLSFRLRRGAAGANTFESHLRAPSPVGIFPESDTADGVCDMIGNVNEWTSSLWEGGEQSGSDFVDPQAMRAQVLSSWIKPQTDADIGLSTGVHASHRTSDSGFRLVSGPPTT